jgi:hypothetical protein
MTEDFINGETTMRLTDPCRGCRTVLGPDRIQDYIAADLKKVGVLLNQNRFKPALEDMANPAVKF